MYGIKIRKAFCFCVFLIESSEELSASEMATFDSRLVKWVPKERAKMPAGLKMSSGLLVKKAVVFAFPARLCISFFDGEKFVWDVQKLSASSNEASQIQLCVFRRLRSPPSLLLSYPAFSLARKSLRNPRFGRQLRVVRRS